MLNSLSEKEKVYLYLLKLENFNNIFWNLSEIGSKWDFAYEEIDFMISKIKTYFEEENGHEREKRSD